MPAPLKYPLTLAAANWLTQQKRPYSSVLVWDVVTRGLPPNDTTERLYEATLPQWIAMLPLNTQEKAAQLQWEFDRKRDYDWVFIPALADDKIWIIQVKYFQQGL